MLKFNTQKILFPFLVLAMVLFSMLNHEQGAAHRYFLSMERDHMAMLVDLSLIKSVMAEVGSLNVGVISGKIKGIEQSIDKVQGAVFAATISSFLLAELLVFSKFKLLAGAVIVFLLLSYFKSISALSKRIIILLLLINPGVTIFSIGLHHAHQHYSAASSLQKKIHAIGQQVEKEKHQLMEAKEASIRKASHENEFEGFLTRVKADVVYTAEEATNSISGDWAMLRTLFKSGSIGLVDDLIGFIIGFIVFLVAAPLLYLLMMLGVAKLICRAFFEGPKTPDTVQGRQPANAKKAIKGTVKTNKKNSEKVRKTPVFEDEAQASEQQKPSVVHGNEAAATSTTAPKPNASKDRFSQQPSKLVAKEKTPTNNSVAKNKSANRLKPGIATRRKQVI